MAETVSLTTDAAAHFFVEGASGNRIHGLDFGGDGPTLVCLHGVTGNAWNWYTVALGVRAHRRVVALDFRGYGESQWSSSHDYTTADHVADVTRAVGCGCRRIAGGPGRILVGGAGGDPVRRRASRQRRTAGCG